METSILLAVQIGKMFLMLLLGFLLVKLNICRSEDSKGLSAVCLYLCTPCMIFCAFMMENTPQRVSSVVASVLVAILINLVMYFVSGIFRKALQLRNQDYLPMFYLNCGNILLPIIVSMLGRDYVVYGIGMVLVQSAMVWTHCISVVSGERKISLRKIFLNPNIVAVYAGVLCFVTGFRLPAFFSDVVEGFSDMIGPVTMLCIGMTLAGLTGLRERIRSILRTALFRLIIVPLAVLPFMYLAAKLIDLPDAKQILMVAYLGAASPSGASLVQLCVKFDNEPEYAGSVNAVTTLLCIVSMPIMIYLFQLVVR